MSGKFHNILTCAISGKLVTPNVYILYIREKQSYKTGFRYQKRTVGDFPLCSFDQNKPSRLVWFQMSPLSFPKLNKL